MLLQRNIEVLFCFHLSSFALRRISGESPAHGSPLGMLEEDEHLGICI